MIQKLLIKVATIILAKYKTISLDDLFRRRDFPCITDGDEEYCFAELHFEPSKMITIRFYSKSKFFQERVFVYDKQNSIIK